MSRQEAAALMARLAAAYVGVTVTADTAEVFYGSCLERITYEHGRQIVDQIIATDEKFPRPARFNEIRRAVERSQEPAVKSIESGPVSEQERDNVRRIIRETKRLVQNHRIGEL